MKNITNIYMLFFVVILLSVFALFGCGDNNTVITPTQTPTQTGQATPTPNVVVIQGEVLDTNEITNDINAIQFLDPNTGYAVGDHQLVLKTINGGDTWDEVHGFSITSSGLLDIQAANNVGFIDPLTGAVVGDDGFSEWTLDGGISWGPIKIEVPAPPVGTNYTSISIATDSSAAMSGEEPDGTPVVVTTGNIKDDEEHWKVKPPPPFSISEIKKLKITIWTIMYGKIYKSIDGGDNWIPDTQANSLGVFNRITFSDDGLRGWAVGQDNVIIFTDDEGQSWHAWVDLDENHKDRSFSRVIITSASGRDATVFTEHGAFLQIGNDYNTKAFDWVEGEVSVGNNKISDSQIDTYNDAAAVSDGNELIIYFVGNSGLIVRAKTTIEI